MMPVLKPALAGWTSQGVMIRVILHLRREHIDLDEKMVRTIGRQTAAERLRRAKIIDADDELQAAEKLVEAGAIMARRPESMQLRYLGTLANIAGEKSSTIAFPLPIDLLGALRGRTASGAPRDAGACTNRRPVAGATG
jgi:hypothetical protein